jgi:hypothetical protein
MKTVEITYRYGAQYAAAPRPLDSNAAHARLNDGNQVFAALLEGIADDNSRVQKIIYVDPRDLGPWPATQRCQNNVRLPPFSAAQTLVCRSN